MTTLIRFKFALKDLKISMVLILSIYFIVKYVCLMLYFFNILINSLIVIWIFT